MKRELAQSIRFTSFRTIEDYPNGEVRREILEAMDLPSRDEDKGAGFDRVLPTAVKELAFPARDEVDLLPIVRLLRIVALGGVQLNIERTARKDRDSQISRWWRTLCQGF